MKFKTFALGGAAIVGLATATLSSAAAYTHHPSTPAEQRQTDDLNAQALTQAQGQATVQTAAQEQQTSTVASGPSSSATASNAQTETASDNSQTGTTTSVASGATSLAAIANPPQTLINASVETSSGQAVGAVQKVVIGSDGRAQSVDVALLGTQSKIVAIDASQLTYDQARNVVVAQLSADEIQALPPAPLG